MAITVDESFEVSAAPDQVWAYLIDPARVVTCLPGAELVEVEDARTFVGRVKVKVGPVTASFRGRASFEELDAASRRVRMSGRGQDTAGAGTASMTMTSEITPLENGGSRIHVHAQVDVVGKLMQFGRGMMEEVSKQIFAQFAACVAASLASGPGDAAPQTPAPIDGLSVLGRAVRSKLFGPKDEA